MDRKTLKIGLEPTAEQSELMESYRVAAGTIWNMAILKWMEWEQGEATERAPYGSDLVDAMEGSPLLKGVPRVVAEHAANCSVSCFRQMWFKHKTKPTPTNGPKFRPLEDSHQFKAADHEQAAEIKGGFVHLPAIGWVKMSERLYSGLPIVSAIVWKTKAGWTVKLSVANADQAEAA